MRLPPQQAEAGQACASHHRCVELLGPLSRHAAAAEGAGAGGDRCADSEGRVACAVHAAGVAGSSSCISSSSSNTSSSSSHRRSVKQNISYSRGCWWSFTSVISDDIVGNLDHSPNPKATKIPDYTICFALLRCRCRSRPAGNPCASPRQAGDPAKQQGGAGRRPRPPHHKSWFQRPNVVA